MFCKEGNFSRRDFIKTVGAASLGSATVPLVSLSQAHGGSSTTVSEQLIVPTRPFGKTGVNVPILGFGTGQDLRSKLLLLRQAAKMGVTYWDTATSYAGGNSEIGIGKYFEKYPEDRKKVFLVTKSHLQKISGWNAHLNRSLENMKTQYIDFFFCHNIYSINSLPPLKETEAWIKKTKAAGKISYFGFSAHHNMEECLMQASKL